MTSMQDRGRSFAEIVNKAFMKLFDDLLNHEDLHKGTEVDFARGLQRLFAESQERWYDEPREALDGLSFNAWLDGLSETDRLDFLQGFSEKLDYDLPERTAEAVRRLSPESRELFLEKITAYRPDADMTKDEALEGIYLLRQFLPLAAAFGNEETRGRLLDWYLDAGVPDERVAEAFSLFIRAQGAEAEPILAAKIRRELGAGRGETNGTDYLLQDLTAICRGEEQLKEDAYLVLREAFRRMKKKQVPAICLGDLGSVRAIPLLRSYVEQNSKSIDRALYYDIVSSIQRLGGSIKDLPDPFKDFSGGRASGPYRLGL